MILAQNVRIYLGDHFELRMTGITLSGFDVAMVEFQFVSRAGMPLWYSNVMDQQMSLSTLSDKLAQVRTKKKEFFAQMERIVP